jgi:hypothetical protein
MPRDFLCRRRPRFSSISRGEIFVREFLVRQKASSFATDYHPGTGINVCRNWDVSGCRSRGRGSRTPLARFRGRRPNNPGAFLRAALADLSDEAGACLRSIASESLRSRSRSYGVALDSAVRSRFSSVIWPRVVRDGRGQTLYRGSAAFWPFLPKAGQFMRLAQPLRTFRSLALPNRGPARSISLIVAVVGFSLSRRPRRYLYPAPPPISQNLGA